MGGFPKILHAMNVLSEKLAPVRFITTLFVSWSVLKTLTEGEDGFVHDCMSKTVWKRAMSAIAAGPRKIDGRDYPVTDQVTTEDRLRQFFEEFPEQGEIIDYEFFEGRMKLINKFGHPMAEKLSTNAQLCVKGRFLTQLLIHTSGTSP